MEFVVSAPPALALPVGPSGQFDWSRCRPLVSDPPRSLDAWGLHQQRWRWRVALSSKGAGDECSGWLESVRSFQQQYDSARELRGAARLIMMSKGGWAAHRLRDAGRAGSRDLPHSADYFRIAGNQRPPPAADQCACWRR
jgi:hypothetical protein